MSKFNKKLQRWLSVGLLMCMMITPLESYGASMQQEGQTKEEQQEGTEALTVSESQTETTVEVQEETPTVQTPSVQAPTEVTVTGRTLPVGWIASESRWWYRNEDGSYPKSTWKLIKNSWYYFDAAGWMVTGWLELSGQNYYLTSSGAMAMGWLKLDGKYYYFNGSGVLQKDQWIGTYYVDANGVWIEGKKKEEKPAAKPQITEGWIASGGRWWYRNADGSYPKNCWKLIKNTWYFFDADGWMKTGWLLRSSGWYYLNPGNGDMAQGWKKVGKYWYYLNPGNGDMAQGWKKIGNTWYYLNPGNGDMAEGWKKIGNAWYYLNPGNGDMAEGWKEIDGKWYYLNPKNGDRMTGWQTIEEKKYYLDPESGERKTGWLKLDNIWYYFNEEDGAMAEGWCEVKGEKYYLTPETGAMKIGWLKLDDTWYFLNGSGVMMTKWVYIGSTWYYLSPEDGKMQTGWLKLKDDKYYLESSGAMVTGWKTIDGEQYYFTSSGVMAVNTTIDGIKLDANGKAEGAAGIKGTTNSLTRFLNAAIAPVGSTLYVWGGGHDVYKDGDAMRSGVNPKWKTFYDSQNSSYDYTQYRNAYQKGLDCSGLVGWSIYNAFYTKSNQNPYMSQSTAFPTFLTNKGLGTHKTVSGGTFTPGDIVSMTGHVWIVLGMCSDESVVIVHATPPMLQISGTVDKNGNANSEAVKLAKAYMNKYYPGVCSRYNLSICGNKYLKNVDRFQWSSSKLSDPAGLRDMSAEEVLNTLIGPLD